MKKVRYDKQLDNDASLTQQADYYDRIDLSDAFDLPNAQIRPAKTKRVHIVVPISIYNEAKWIGEKAGTGYQNALKMAMAIGLKGLREKLTPS
jgi:hypothetical protein